MKEALGMKRFTFFIAMAVALYFSGSLAYAQHPHGAGGGAAPGLGAHESSEAHGDTNNPGTGTSNGVKSESASTQLTENQHLDTALTKALGNLVPSGGLSTACTGFKNLGGCVSAIHVAHNRKLDFFCLRRAMTGTAIPTSDTAAGMCTATQTNLKLGKAIQVLDPSADSKAEANKGTKQADTDMDSANHSQT
jgi:hypothetical protein